MQRVELSILMTLDTKIDRYLQMPLVVIFLALPGLNGRNTSIMSKHEDFESSSYFLGLPI